MFWYILISFAIGAIAGFVAGILVGRKNPKKVETVVGKAKELKG